MRPVLDGRQATEPLQAVSPGITCWPADGAVEMGAAALCYRPRYSTSWSLGRGRRGPYLRGSLANLNYTQHLTAPGLWSEFLRFFAVRCGDPYAGKYSDKTNHQVESDRFANELCGE
jgi:hypothetical protein